MATLFAVAIFISGQAQTQELDEKPILETTVVSGNRTNQAISDVSASISSVEAETVKTVSAEHINQILSRIPGTWISRGNGQEHLTAIRSPVLTGAGACGAFLMAQDDIPLRASGFCNVNQLFDSHFEVAEKIEVFRGPNSTAFGGNALFGGINVLLPNPAEKKRSHLKLELGQFDYLRTGLEHSLSSDANDFWFAATLVDDKGYRDHSGYDQQKFSGKHTWTSGTLSVTNSLDYTNLEQHTAGFIEGEGAYKNEALIRSNANPEAFRKAESFRAYSRWTWALQNGDLSITPWVRKNDMRFLMHFVPWQPLEENAQQSVGARLSWNTKLSEKWHWQSGFEVESTRASLLEFQENPAPFGADRFPIGVHYDYDVDALSTAIFAGLRFKISNNLNLEWLSRFDSNAYDYNNLADNGSVCADDVEGCRFYRPADSKNTFHFNSNKLGLNYRPTDNIQVYANLAQSWRPPQASELYRLQQGQESADLTEVSLNNAEMGFRGQLDAFSYQLAVFNMKKTDGIFQDSERQYVSGSDSSHKGIEYQLHYHFSTQLSAQFSGSYAKHQYTNSPNLLGSSALISGNEIDTAPKSMNALMVKWQPGNNVFAELELLKMGHYYTDPENTHEYNGHLLTNLRTRYFTNPHLTLGLSVTNLLDVKYAERADISFGTPRYFPGQERSITFHLDWSFSPSAR